MVNSPGEHYEEVTVHEKRKWSEKRGNCRTARRFTCVVSRRILSSSNVLLLPQPAVARSPLKSGLQERHAARHDDFQLLPDSTPGGLVFRFRSSTFLNLARIDVV